MSVLEYISFQRVIARGELGILRVSRLRDTVILKWFEAVHCRLLQCSQE